MEADIITIDGPTSSGKNSVGFLLSQKLGYKYIDTGMIYRAGAFKVLENKVSVEDLEKILEIYRNLDIRFEMNDHWKMLLDGEDVTDKLHTPELSRLVPLVAAKPQVRQATKNIQRRIAQEGKVVMSGRDIGSEIFPDAKFKFFLTASTEVRAERRFKQLSKMDPLIKYEDVLEDMKERDEKDSTREASPMRIPQNAVVIDNSNLTVKETVEEILKEVQKDAQS